jgi:hypothetical protein
MLTQTCVRDALGELAVAFCGAKDRSVTQVKLFHTLNFTGMEKGGGVIGMNMKVLQDRLLKLHVPRVERIVRMITDVGEAWNAPLFLSIRERSLKKCCASLLWDEYYRG